ncbi:ribonuclease P protein component [Streptococcus oralis]|uniref:Ribonuclease P protein component n=11 Tax=Bacteria TaxID=2 RepID=A0A1S0Z5U5_SALET|nr:MULTISPECIES: ribonuclease P protein component [Streptococcus]AHZ47007.1 ribonuclease P [Streptococcus sp. VT 162]EGL86490.1 ribonuclease P protein component [Streptococcus oralis SK255]EKA12220.1 ribonuclease P [Streptococcus sp. GMD2S]EMG31769.1 ribonuclease P [Streptococcus oralis subsp. tigurinus AZ_3a]MBF1708255.1 ribonuclease P protein component [Streptococcus sanguinis]RSJ35146.1 Ribonuclease P protein component [Streptococcus sp. BCA20]
MKKSFRVKREKDFKAIFKDGTSFANRKFVVYQLENQQNHFRVGLSVSKKLGNAVTRNQIKRRIRHILQSVKGSLVEHVDFVVIARKGVETLEYAEMEKNLLHVLKLSKIYQEGNGSEKETTVD